MLEGGRGEVEGLGLRVQLPGFISPEGLLHGVEVREAPLRTFHADSILIQFLFTSSNLSIISPTSPFSSGWEIRLGF